MIDELYSMVCKYETLNDKMNNHMDKAVVGIRDFVRKELRRLDKEDEKLVKFVNDNRHLFYQINPNETHMWNRVRRSEYTHESYYTSSRPGANTLTIGQLRLWVDFENLRISNIEIDSDYCYRNKVGLMWGVNKPVNTSKDFDWKNDSIDYWVDRKRYVDTMEEILSTKTMLMKKVMEDIVSTQKTRARDIIDACNDIVSKQTEKPVKVTILVRV